MQPQQKQTNFRQANIFAHDSFAPQPRQPNRKVQKGIQAEPKGRASDNSVSKLKGKRATKNAEKAVGVIQKNRTSPQQQYNNSSASGQSSRSKEEFLGLISNAESLDYIPVTSAKQIRKKSGLKVINKEMSIISAANHKAGADMDEQSSEQDDSGPMPSSVPNFLVKTYEIVNDTANEATVQWNSSGTGFVVNKANEFAENVLPRYFKHNNFSSFVRQLNMYNFHKSRDTRNRECFRHDNFVRGQKHLLALIAKKKKKRDMDKGNQGQSAQQQQQQANGQNMAAMARLNNFQNSMYGMHNTGGSGMPQLTDNPANSVDLMSETKMQPQLMPNEYTQAQMEQNGFELSSANAIMPTTVGVRPHSTSLSIMPAQGGFELRARGGERSHEHCEADIMRMERRLKDFENIVKALNEKNEYVQGQVLMLLTELNKYKERDRHIEQVMLMALHLLVNLAGFNTFPQAPGGASTGPAALFSELFGKNRPVTTRNVQSPIPNQSESESQPGSISHQKTQNQDGKGITTRELKDPNVLLSQDGQESESQADDALVTDKDEKKNPIEKILKGFSKYQRSKDSDQMIVRSSMSNQNYQNQPFLDTSQILNALKDVLNGNTSGFQSLNAAISQGGRNGSSMGGNNTDWQYLAGQLAQVLKQMDPSSVHQQQTGGYKQFNNQHLLSQLFNQFSGTSNSQPQYDRQFNFHRNIPASPQGVSSQPEYLQRLVEMIQDSGSSGGAEKQRQGLGFTPGSHSQNSARLAGVNQHNSGQSFQMPSPRPNNYVDSQGNPQSNSNINHDKMFHSQGRSQHGGGLSEKNDESYGFSYNGGNQGKRVSQLNLNKQSFSPFKRDGMRGMHQSNTPMSGAGGVQNSGGAHNNNDLLSTNKYEIFSSGGPGNLPDKADSLYNMDIDNMPQPQMQARGSLDMHQRSSLEALPPTFTDNRAPVFSQNKSSGMSMGNGVAPSNLFPQGGRLSQMKAEDNMSGMNRSRLNSIGGESSHYGGMSEVDTSKYLREPPSQQNISFANPSNSHQPQQQTQQREQQAASASFSKPGGGGNANGGVIMRDFNAQAANPSEPSMVSQDESTQQRRTRNLEFQRTFDQMANLNQEQQQLIAEIASGKITRKDIPAYDQSSRNSANNHFRGLVDRTYLGANSHISFEELSASGGAGSIHSSRQQMQQPQTLQQPVGSRQLSLVQQNLSQMEQQSNAQQTMQNSAPTQQLHARFNNQPQQHQQQQPDQQ